MCSVLIIQVQESLMTSKDFIPSLKQHKTTIYTKFELCILRNVQFDLAEEQHKRL